MSSPAPVLEMRDVARSFATAHGRVEVLRSVNLRVAEGEFIAVTGPSGSGKTTLLHLAALLDRPDRGAIRFEDRDVSALPEEQQAEIRKLKIGMVFQTFCLLPHRTALENVAFRFRYLGLSGSEARSRSEEILRAFGMLPIADQPARLLSGGEMQRLAIARAVVARPRLLLADEPTGNLDRDSTRTVMETLRTLHDSGLSVVLATHNENLLAYCSRRLVCDGGCLKEAAP
jgi:putative ABC transport system ATP-binding protein